MVDYRLKVFADPLPELAGVAIKVSTSFLFAPCSEPQDVDGIGATKVTPPVESVERRLLEKRDTHLRWRPRQETDGPRVHHVWLSARAIVGNSAHVCSFASHRGRPVRMSLISGSQKPTRIHLLKPMTAGCTSLSFIAETTVFATSSLEALSRLMLLIRLPKISQLSATVPSSNSAPCRLLAIANALSSEADSPSRVTTSGRFVAMLASSQQQNRCVADVTSTRTETHPHIVGGANAARISSTVNSKRAPPPDRLL